MTDYDVASFRNQKRFTQKTSLPCKKLSKYYQIQNAIFDFCTSLPQTQLECQKQPIVICIEYRIFRQFSHLSIQGFGNSVLNQALQTQQNFTCRRLGIAFLFCFESKRETRNEKTRNEKTQNSNRGLFVSFNSKQDQNLSAPTSVLKINYLWQLKCECDPRPNLLSSV